MEKLNDIEINLNNEIDIKSDYKLSDLNPSKLTKKNINDLSKTKKKSILDLSSSKSIKLNKLKTKLFDSFYKSKKMNDIDLITPKKDFLYFLNKHRLFFKKHYLFFKLRDNKSKNKLFNLKKKHKRYILFLVFISFLLVVNKILIEKLVTYGYDRILSIKEDFSDITTVKHNISKAKSSFYISNTLFKPFSFLPNDNVNNVEYIIKGGLELSKLLDLGLRVYTETNNFIIDKGGPQNIYLTNLLENLRTQYSSIYSSLYKALYYYSKVGDLGSISLNSKLSYAKENLRYALLFLDTIEKNYDTMLSLLGHNSEKKYLVLFQNNDEIRPTGGFIGSSAIITLRYGKVVRIENNDVYALEWLINKVYTDKRKAPEGLDKITGTFGLRDANYYPEFKDSSNNIKYFLDKIDFNVDGIIYINQNVILDLLSSIGGIESKGLEMNITDKNFSLVISTLVEAKVFKVGSLGTPKQVLFDFAGELYNELLLKKDFISYFNIVSKHIKTRDIVFYSFNPEENSLLWKLGINGEINYKSTLDFNYPIYTSIGGNKTDRYIGYRYDKTIKKIDGTCDFDANLTIYKTHGFSQFDDEQVENLLTFHNIPYKNDILNIQGRGDNKSFTRIILPKNIILHPESGQKLIENDNYNVLELYINTSRFETSRNIINYRVVNNDCLDYTYKFFKQPGIRNYDINFDLFDEKNKYKNIQTDFLLKNN